MSSRVLTGPHSPLKGRPDRRRTKQDAGGARTKIHTRRTLFTANGVGTTTTLVGANAAPGTNDDNIVRRGDKFMLYNSSGVLKEDTVFKVTDIAVGASTTVTFSPAAAVATASGDVAKLVGLDDMEDPDSLDAALKAFNSTVYSDARLAQMTIKDKLFAYQQNIDTTR